MSKPFLEAVKRGEIQHTYQRLEFDAIAQIEAKPVDSKHAREIVASYLKAIGCGKLVEAWVECEKHQ